VAAALVSLALRPPATPSRNMATCRAISKPRSRPSSPTTREHRHPDARRRLLRAGPDHSDRKGKDQTTDYRQPPLAAPSAGRITFRLVGRAVVNRAAWILQARRTNHASSIPFFVEILALTALGWLRLSVRRLRLCPFNRFGHDLGCRLGAVERGELNFCADIVMPHVRLNARGLRIDKLQLSWSRWNWRTSTSEPSSSFILTRCQCSALVMRTARLAAAQSPLIGSSSASR
jgi:hypothetical protein